MGFPGCARLVGFGRWFLSQAKDPRGCTTLISRLELRSAGSLFVKLDFYDFYELLSFFFKLWIVYKTIWIFLSNRNLFNKHIYPI